MPDVIITPSSGIIEFKPSSTTVNKIEASGTTFNLVNTVSQSGTIFNIEGTNGSLFSVVDNLDGTLMSVNNNAGLPVLEVFSDDSVVAGRFGQNDLVVSSSGNVGVGKVPNNSYKLDVKGKININNSISVSDCQIYVDDTDGYLVLDAGLNGQIDLQNDTVINGSLSSSNSLNWDTAYDDRFKWDGGNLGLTASTGRTSLGATTVGSNVFTLSNPSAIRFIRINADNTVSALSDSDFRTAIGGGTVTSIAGVGTVAGLTLTGTVTTSGSLTLGGTLSVAASDFSSQTAKTFLAAPNASNGVPTFRTIVASDIPTLNQDTTGNAGTVTNGVYTTGNQSISGVKTFTSQIINTTANNTATGGGQIYLNGATGNRIDFVGNGVAAPAFTTRSVGTKIVLYPEVGASTVDYAIGIESDTFWQSIPGSSARQFKWYAGTTNIATLTGSGVLTVAGATSQINVDNLRLDGNTLSATNSNGSLIIAPNGTGALVGSTTGNPRGTNAVDLQTSRSAVTQVASGANSVIGGGNSNTSSGGSSTVGGGQTNTSSGLYSTVGGGVSNTSSGSRSTVGGGAYNTSSGGFSTVSGGRSNISSNSYSTVGGGDRNLAFSNQSFVGAGQNNVAAQKVRRANNITASTTTITVLGAVAADFDNTTANALQIRYRVGFSGAFSSTTRTVSTATQSGDNVTLVVTSNVGAVSPNQWTNVTVVNTAETDTSAGQVVGGGINNISTNTNSTVGGGNNNTSSGLYSTVGGGVSNTSSIIFSTVGGGSNNTSSGFASTVGGGRNNTSSAYASTVGGGASNTSSAYASTVGGGFNNASTNGYSTVGGGAYNTSSGLYSTVGGGKNNTSSISFSTVGGGQSNTSSDSFSTVGGGSNNTSSGFVSTVGGGASNTSSGSYSTIPGGQTAKTLRHGELSHAAGQFANQGDAQHTILIARNVTTNATAAVLFLNGSNARLTIPAETTWVFDIKLSAYNDTNNLGAGWNIRGAIRRNAANGTAILGTNSTTTWTDGGVMNSLMVSVTADDTNEALQINVTGLASTNIRWVAVVDISQVSYAAP